MLPFSHIPNGKVAEWLKAPLSKSGIPETVSRVRISPFPLKQKGVVLYGLFFASMMAEMRSLYL